MWSPSLWWSSLARRTIMMDASKASAISSSLFSPWNLYRAPEATAHIPALDIKTGRPSDASFLSLGGKYCRSSDQGTISRFSLQVLDDATLLAIDFCPARHWLKISIQDKHAGAWQCPPSHFCQASCSHALWAAPALPSWLDALPQDTSRVKASRLKGEEVRKS